MSVEQSNLQEFRDLKDKVTTYETLLMEMLASGFLVGSDDGRDWQRKISDALGLPPSQ